LVFVKSTMFKNKIQSRSEVEIRQYFAKLLEDFEKGGYMDPKRYRV